MFVEQIKKLHEILSIYSQMCRNNLNGKRKFTWIFHSNYLEHCFWTLENLKESVKIFGKLLSTLGQIILNIFKCSPY